MRIIFRVCLFPLFQGKSQCFDTIEFFYPNQILFERSDNPFCIRISFGITETGKNLLNSEFGPPIYDHMQI